MFRMGLVVSNSTHDFQTFVGKNINTQFPGPPNYWLEESYRWLQDCFGDGCNSMACAGLVVEEARGVWFFAFGLCERGELHWCVYVCTSQGGVYSEKSSFNLPSLNISVSTQLCDGQTERVSVVTKRCFTPVHCNCRSDREVPQKACFWQLGTGLNCCWHP